MPREEIEDEWVGVDPLPGPSRFIMEIACLNFWLMKCMIQVVLAFCRTDYLALYTSLGRGLAMCGWAAHISWCHNATFAFFQAGLAHMTGAATGYSAQAACRLGATGMFVSLQGWDQAVIIQCDENNSCIGSNEERVFLNNMRVCACSFQVLVIHQLFGHTRGHGHVLE